MFVLAGGAADADQLFVLHHHVDATQLLLRQVHVGLGHGQALQGINYFQFYRLELFNCQQQFLYQLRNKNVCCEHSLENYAVKLVLRTYQRNLMIYINR